MNINQINLPDMVMDARGAIAAPGSKFPLEDGDMLRDPGEDYDFAVRMYLDPGSNDPEEASTLLRAWIRRAAHAEQFAAALEAELTARRYKDVVKRKDSAGD